MIKSSRTRKVQRRKVALENRKKQLQFWKDKPVTKEFTKELKKNKIAKAEYDINILNNRV